jgi:hypothetical protein
MRGGRRPYVKSAPVDSMAPGRAQGYLRSMKLALVWLMRWVPGTVLVVIGVANIVAGYVPALARRIGHGPFALSIGVIVFGGLSLALTVWVTSVEKRYRQFIASRRANA